MCDCKTKKQAKVMMRPCAEREGLVKPDPVNHPPHYQGASMEAIDIIEAFGLNFRLGNAAKYVLRAGKKHDKKQDLEKAIWYLQRELNQLTDEKN